jgi:DNA-binding PadR family transcriptional regulator
MVAMVRTRDEHELLLGEWACLGILYEGPSHGYAIAARLKPDQDVGRVWSMSRPRTYGALEHLGDRGYIRAVGEERGFAGGNRTIIAATRSGRARLRNWMATPVAHMRDLRSELLLKLVLADMCGLDVGDMLDRQREIIERRADAYVHAEENAAAKDVVTMWRSEYSSAALRFVEQLSATAAR